IFYNQSGQLLCGLTFDNSIHRIGRRFADNTYTPTAETFKNDEVMDVTVRFDFQKNLWSVSIGTGSIPPQPIARDFRAGNIGSMDITWRSVVATKDGTASGDNQMVFDDLVVSAVRK